MANRRIALLIAAAGTLAVVPDAEASLVYVKRANSAKPQVWTASDTGSKPRRLGTGTRPAISPDGKWVAWRDPANEAVLLRKVNGRNVRRVARSVQLGEVEFSPDSRWLGVGLRNRLLVHDLQAHTNRTVAHGGLNGISFSPDSTALVYGSYGRRLSFDAPSDLYTVDLVTGAKFRVTRDRKSLNPLWGPAGEVVFDRQTRRDGDAPTYNLFGIHPDGGALRRLTSLKIPPLLSGLVPVEMSADGSRLLAEFAGQATSVGFAVNPATGNTRALSKSMETGLVASDLTADGRTVLGMTGGPDPSNRHDVVTIRYTGGKPKVLVKRAAYPDWTH
jgi:hypothetical protein